MLLIKRKKKPRLKSNPWVSTSRSSNNWAPVFFFFFFCSNSQSHNHFVVSQWYITWACVAFLFCHLIIIKPRVTQWAGMSKYYNSKFKMTQ